MAHLIQSEFDIRCEWGLHGVQSLVPFSDVVVIVDVLSFSTCVDIATASGAAMLPYRFDHESARDYGRARGAMLAGRRGSASEYSLSPAGLLGIPTELAWSCRPRPAPRSRSPRVRRQRRPAA